MLNGKKKPDTLKQRRTRYYLRMMLGAYLLYTAYEMFKNLKGGVEADQPILIGAAILLFAVAGVAIIIVSFRGAMRISVMELKEQEEQENQEDQENQETQTDSETPEAPEKSADSADSREQAADGGKGQQEELRED